MVKGHHSKITIAPSFLSICPTHVCVCCVCASVMYGGFTVYEAAHE